jgi:hypothetical protein
VGTRQRQSERHDRAASPSEVSPGGQKSSSFSSWRQTPSDSST